MLFNSIEFGFFLPTVFILYWFVAKKNTTRQNLVLMAASYLFYGWWDYRFLFLLVFSTFLDFFTGLKIHRSQNASARKTWLLVSVVTNLGFLGFFKYYNFFVDSFAALIGKVGLHPDLWTLQIILPIGISFYTFHGLSYVFDIYNRKIEPTLNYINYSVFVCFFPLLVAGPIERATHLLPQVENARTFDYAKAVDGLRQILWGLFKKIVIADRCAVYVNLIFSDYRTEPGSILLLGVFYFAIQIYCDFSGYSDIAIGTAKLFDFELIRNFKYPYFSRSVPEFWRKWHISLTTWFRDYLYIPLGGSQVGKGLLIRNVVLVFLISGLWHGANWTFIVWGLLNALYFLPSLYWKSTHVTPVATWKDLPRIGFTFALTLIAWVFFRSGNVGDAFEYLGRMFSLSLFSMPPKYLLGILPVVIVLVIEWIAREKEHPLMFTGKSVFWRWGVYVLLVLLVSFNFKFHDPAEFIYFQF